MLSWQIKSQASSLAGINIEDYNYFIVASKTSWTFKLFRTGSAAFEACFMFNQIQIMLRRL